MSAMIEVKTAYLIGPALDWAVAKCEGEQGSLLLWIPAHSRGEMNYSTDWSQGGPLIEKHRVVCDYGRPRQDGEVPRWFAQRWAPYAGEYGGTPLIAACRAIVAAELGDVVSVPAGLVGGGV